MFYQSRIINCLRLFRIKNLYPKDRYETAYSIFTWEIHVGHPDCSLHTRQSLGGVSLRKISHLAQMFIVLMKTLCFRSKEKPQPGILLWKRMATGCFLCTYMDMTYFKETFPLKIPSILCARIYYCISLKASSLGHLKMLIHPQKSLCLSYSLYLLEST